MGYFHSQVNLQVYCHHRHSVLVQSPVLAEQCNYFQTNHLYRYTFLYPSFLYHTGHVRYIQT